MSGMSKDVSFSLDTKGGEEILTSMVAPVIQQSANAIAARARSMAGSISSQPPAISVNTARQTSRRGGSRTVAIIRAEGNDDHQNYIGYQALAKARDAGQV